MKWQQIIYSWQKFALQNKPHMAKMVHKFHNTCGSVCMYVFVLVLGTSSQIYDRINGRKFVENDAYY